MSTIAEFWSWFAAHAALLANDTRRLGELDAWIERLGPVGWEIGPGILEPNQLTISPDGDRDLLPLTKAIVRLSPPIPGWEFHWAKPPKQWTGRIAFRYRGDELEIDVSSWRYVLYQYDDGMFDVEIEAATHDLSRLDWGDVVAEVVVDALLGEARRLELVNEATLVQRIDENDAKASPLMTLAEHLDAIVGQ